MLDFADLYQNCDIKQVATSWSESPHQYFNQCVVYGAVFVTLRIGVLY